MKKRRVNRQMRTAACILLFGLNLFMGCGNAAETVPDVVVGEEQAGHKGQSSLNAQGVPEASGSGDAQESVRETGSPGSQNVVQESDSGTPEERSRLISELLDSWDWDYGAVSLEQVTKELDHNHIHYVGYYNVSGERLDMTLEDGTDLVFFEMRTAESRQNFQRTGNYELVIKGTEFNKNGFQENFLNQYDVTDDEFIYPNLSEREFSENEFYQFNQTELSMARNQIFAKYGRKFQDTFLASFFSTKTWYDAIHEGAQFDGRQQEYFNEIERKNLAALLKIEEYLHYRKSGDYDVARRILSGSWLDLDGDGQEERLVYEKQEPEEDYGILTFCIYEEGREDEKAAKAEYEGFAVHDGCYIISMDQKHYQIVAAQNGMSDDFAMEFYEYGETGLKDLGGMEADVYELRVLPDRLEAPVETIHIQCEPIDFTYTIENQTLKQQERDYYEYRGNRVEVLCQISLMKEKEGTEEGITLMPGEQAVILGGDLKEWVQIEQVSTGEKGWLKVTQFCECHLPEGVRQSSECFEGLTFYG